MLNSPVETLMELSPLVADGILSHEDDGKCIEVLFWALSEWTGAVELMWMDVGMVLSLSPPPTSASPAPIIDMRLSCTGSNTAPDKWSSPVPSGSVRLTLVEDGDEVVTWESPLVTVLFREAFAWIIPTGCTSSVSAFSCLIITTSGDSLSETSTGKVGSSQEISTSWCTARWAPLRCLGISWASVVLSLELQVGGSGLNPLSQLGLGFSPEQSRSVNEQMI